MPVSTASAASCLRTIFRNNGRKPKYSASTVGTANGATGSSVTNAYAALVEGVGAMASQATIDTTATAAVLTSATDSRDSVSGVNLDEEAANLVKFQQYYTASSQIIKTAQTIFQTLISSL